jgi:hypothetical protein
MAKITTGNKLCGNEILLEMVSKEKQLQFKKKITVMIFV